ncbi:MAG: hypothetical protein QF618_07585, partial [SAR324 cluster bacterium]|nr:hypothetical protein [SAR324 cluster bacterium]
FTKSGRIFSGRVHDRFETQNGFTTFRGMPSLVPKFAFLVVEIGLRNPQFEIFFRNWDFAQRHGAFYSVWV